MNPDNDTDALALTMLGEARGEGRSGMVAVGNVIMNRVAAKIWFGDTIQSVCLKPWQFSCWNKSDPNRDYLLNLSPVDNEFVDATGIALGLISGSITDTTNQATSYYSNDIAPPKWAVGITPCATIGNLIFFKGV